MIFLNFPVMNHTKKEQATKDSIRATKQSNKATKHIL